MCLKILALIGLIFASSGTVLLWHSSPSDHSPANKIIGNDEAFNTIVANNSRMRGMQKLAISLIILGAGLQVPLIFA